MALAETDTELRAWLDRLAIQDLINRYADGVTRADWDQVEAVFAPDAVWESPGLGMRYESRAAFMEMVAGTSSDSGVFVQTPHASVIRLTGSDRAEASTTTYELFRGESTTDSTLGGTGAEINFEQCGIYYDDVARIDGETMGNGVVSG
jgi:hypothetical protein